MSTPTSNGGEAVTLENCEAEPIHVPAAIQPHGVLLAVSEPDLVIRHVSNNSEAHLRVAPRNLLAQGLEAALDAPSVALVRELCGTHSLRDVNPIKLRARQHDGTFDGILHRSGDLLLLELEESRSAGELTFGQFYRRVRKAVGRLRETQRVMELASFATEEVRNLTGFDRVMLYRFAPDASGEVIAEAKREDLEPFLGLHYPASDIPAQARRLYLLNWLRLIVDVDYVPAALEPRTHATTGEPIDLSHSVLRSVSPIHCEYLRNMGVRASMSISLVVDGKLWGLVACHHYEPRFVPYEARAAAEFLGEALSWQIGARERSDTFERQAASQRVLSRLVEEMSTHANPVIGLASDPSGVLELVGATGAALFYEGKHVLVGATPSLGEARALVTWLSRADPHEVRPGVFVCDALALSYSDAPVLDGVAGVLAVAVAGEQGDFLIWFRPEVEQTVNWGGEPTKNLTVKDGVARLSPRGSFALWKETVRGRALPWESFEVDLAVAMRNATLGGIQKRAVELARLNDELRASNLAKDEFLATISHELRTPLNSMLGWLHLMETRDLPPDKRQQALETVTRNARHQAKLVEDLLDVARITSGKMRLDVQSVNPLSVVELAVESVRPTADAKGVRLQVILDPKAGPISGDPQRLQQVIWNLLTNAIKFTPKLGKIRISLSRVNSSIEISVVDDGSGISPEFLPHVFERFRQAQGDSRRVHKGLGLGLAVVKNIVELHGGQVTASSDGEGRGAAFVVRLPLAPVRAEVQGEHPEADAPGRAPELPQLHGLRVLVVDDERDAVDLLSAMLTRLGVQVSTANSAFDAFELLQSTEQDVLVSDVGMPGMDGFDLIRRVRGLSPEQNGHIAAVALTAFTRAQDRARGFLAGFDVYLPKPVDPSELTALLVSLAGRLDRRTPVPVVDRPRSVPPPRGEIQETMTGVRVLLVEREQLEVREILAGALRQTGAIVEVAGSAEAAHAAARRFRPDLLVAASSLPDVDGFLLLKQLRTNGSEGGGWIPAVALLSENDEVRRALLAGYQLQVVKPVEPERLVARIVRLVGWSVRR